MTIVSISFLKDAQALLIGAEPVNHSREFANYSLILFRMKLSFTKYQGTGNDFILIDNSKGDYKDFNPTAIPFLCDRKFGIGADGVILIASKPGYDFEMIYFNSDGSQSFCGNGARCAVAFAKRIGLIEQSAHFLAIDGEHRATIRKDIVELEMNDVNEIKHLAEDFTLNTGSPHYIRFTTGDDLKNIVPFGREIRYSDPFKQEGINVNLVAVEGPDTIRVATYERGVEDETLSCGTGVTACALAFHERNPGGKGIVHISTKGGDLSVQFSFDQTLRRYVNIKLIGPATRIFDGTINLS